MLCAVTATKDSAGSPYVTILAWQRGHATYRPIHKGCAWAAALPGHVCQALHRSTATVLLTLCCVPLLPPHTLLALCLLACWLGREAVCHTDLIRGALLGQLPFLDMPARCRSLMQSPAGAALPVSLMKSSRQKLGMALPEYHMTTLHAVCCASSRMTKALHMQPQVGI